MRIEKGTIARTVVLVVALINQILTMTGYNPLPFADDAVYEGVTAVLTVVGALWAWWKNSSFTPEAIAADHVMRALKDGRATVGDVEGVIDGPK